MRWLDCEHAKTRTILGRYYDKFYFHIGTLNDTLCTPHIAIQSTAKAKGAQWLSGRVLDSRPKSRGFEPHRRHYVVSLSKNINPSLVLVQPRKTRPFITERLLMGRKESNQTNKQKRQKRCQACKTV